MNTILHSNYWSMKLVAIGHGLSFLDFRSMVALKSRNESPKHDILFPPMGHGCALKGNDFNFHLLSRPIWPSCIYFVTILIISCTLF